MSFSNPSLDGYLVKSALELAIDGDVRITRADDVLYEEEMVSVVELAEQLNAWLSEGPRGDTAFEYRSIESSVPVMLWFRLLTAVLSSATVRRMGWDRRSRANLWIHWLSPRQPRASFSRSSRSRPRSSVST